MAILFCMNTWGFVEIKYGLLQKQNDAFPSSQGLTVLYIPFEAVYCIIGLCCLGIEFYWGASTVLCSLLPQFGVILVLYGLVNIFNPISEAEVWVIGGSSDGCYMPAVFFAVNFCPR